MDYLLFTGATGLLGRYLLWEFAQRRQRMAVVVRRSRAASARQRIEDVMRSWEKRAGRYLLRPVVLEGDLTQPCLGLDDDQQQWIRNHCSSIVHNAASLTFVAECPEGEPYRSNIEGTKNALELCRRTNISTFQHVSTAYVCGSRSGLILENEWDEGQSFRNDYERSKFEGERLVREADFIQSLTIHRPGIIIGDSRTGYTSTFHGFYVPLSAAYSLAGRLPFEDSSDPTELIQLFGMQGHEKKNFVPVDWVAKIMSLIILDRQYHGQVYHLTPGRRTALGNMVRAILRAFVDHPPQKLTPIDLQQFEQQMRDLMSVYSSYWDEDPQFDQRNTLQSFPDHPCPDLDDACLKRTCDFAIKSNFGWPREPSIIPEFDLHSWISPEQWTVTTNQCSIGISISGSGGGDWTLHLSTDSKPLSVVPGLSPDCRGRITANSSTFQQLVGGNWSLDEAIRDGALHIDFDADAIRRLALSSLPDLLKRHARNTNVMPV